MRMTSPPRLPGLVVGREFVAYCALDRLVLIIHPLPRRLQLWEVLDAALDGDHAGICAGAMMATCRGAAAQLSQAGERGREQGARPRSRYPPFDKRRHATCTRRAHSCSNLPKCGVFCMLLLGELPRVPDRSTGGTGGARCTTVRASGPYLRYGYRRFAPYHVLVHSAHPYRVGPGKATWAEDADHPQR
jgi:hypothetical protein